MWSSTGRAKGQDRWQGGCGTLVWSAWHKSWGDTSLLALDRAGGGKQLEKGRIARGDIIEQVALGWTGPDSQVSAEITELLDSFSRILVSIFPPFPTRFIALNTLQTAIP